MIRRKNKSQRQLDCGIFLPSRRDIRRATRKLREVYRKRKRASRGPISEQHGGIRVYPATVFDFD